MIAKKNSGLDLERKRTVLFQVGLLTAASFTLAAFTYTSKIPRPDELLAFEADDSVIIVDFDEPDKVLKQQPTLPQPPQPQEQPPTFDPNPQEPSMDLLNARAEENGKSIEIPKFGPPSGFPKGTYVDIDDQDLDPFPPTPAEYKGGILAMQEYISKHVVYPEIDRNLGNEGIVHTSFIIEKDGSVSHVKIERGVSETIDREAIRVVKLLNQWIPAQNAFGKVRTTAHLPIRFFLND